MEQQKRKTKIKQQHQHKEHTQTQQQQQQKTSSDTTWRFYRFMLDNIYVRARNNFEKQHKTSGNKKQDFTSGQRTRTTHNTKQNRPSC